MANKMLIDAAHPEETRVTVVRGNRVEEFDFEAANRRQLRGNIYLARVTRVEPSLQAAFVEYGGNRHGFLAFSEIHPDYYQLPKADREELERQLAAEAEANQKERERREREEAERAKTAADAENAENSEDDDENAEELDAALLASLDAPFEEHAVEEIVPDPEEGESEGEEPHKTAASSASLDATASQTHGEAETGGEDDDTSSRDAKSEGDAPEVRSETRIRRLRDRYKIQEVIKRRQLLVVQVVKEERGNKGAALTTYMSLAGRYSVLMPNTDRGGGISRKITKPTDRKRLKQIAGELNVPEGMGVILRTAGASRTKAEIKRDFEYLMRLWENVRELTLNSAAPTLVYEEGSLVKRAIRDLYNKDIDQVIVSGEIGYREAKNFMRMLMPSHSKNVQPYRDATPIFTRYSVEAQLDAMFSPQVTLKSGGYIVINQTEALVSVDVNSGKSTREQNIEDTALATNMEAAEEIARQLRLRDLAGLVVIDFIDMEESRNNRSVERKLKECLKADRARIQVGRISHFGLLEMSRQRLRTGVLESSSSPCPHCHGSGIVRSVESVALYILRALEDQLLRGATHNITVNTPTDVALYILNQKRGHITELEKRFGLSITLAADDSVSGQHFTLERGELATPVHLPAEDKASVQPDTLLIPEEESEGEEENETEDSTEEEQKPTERRRRRRRRRRGSPASSEEDISDTQQGEETDEDAPALAAEGEQTDEAAENAGEDASSEEQSSDDEDSDYRRRRRRGRRGGRRSRKPSQDEAEATQESASEGETAPVSSEGETKEVSPAPEQASTPQEQTQSTEAVTSASAEAEASEASAEAGEQAEAKQEDRRRPRPRRRPRRAPARAAESAAQDSEITESAPAPEAAPAAEAAPASDVSSPQASEEAAAPKPRTPRPRRRPTSSRPRQPRETTPAKAEGAPASSTQSVPVKEVKTETAKPAPEPKQVAPAPQKAAPVVTSEKVAPKPAGTPEKSGNQPKSGWWQRRSFF
ncbi:Rne/Rng family ribonuclease [Flexibacterium corallicola]|uniref:Rne/Rng family ribonuclease n=1 Tax=Flexibacterium corallicola TaxID=3037259 RepID=UPI00286F5736|nr:Rne/Rng family ribonuclease [Pseudovibrio sp. M1P-2-3]